MENFTMDNQFYFMMGGFLGIIIQVIASGISEIAWYFTEYRKMKIKKKMEKQIDERSRNHDADPHDR